MNYTNYLIYAENCKRSIKDIFDDGISYITEYLKNALVERGLDGAVRKGNERNTGVLVVEDGVIKFVKKKRQRSSSKLTSSNSCVSETYQIYYNGADWLRYEHQMSPDEIIDKLVNVYHFKSADIKPADRLGITTEQLQRVKAYCDGLNMDEADALHCVAGFEHNGQTIVNIFKSPSCRFDYDIDKAIEVYGLKNVKDFCERVLEGEGRTWM